MTTDKHGWYSVSSNPPKPHTTVFVWPEPSDTCMTAQLRLDRTWWYAEYTRHFGWENEKMHTTPTHWRPLFEPPEGV